MFTFRITHDDDQKIKTLCKDRIMLVCKENSDIDEKNCTKTHYHGICYEDVTRQTLRNWIFEAFPEDYFEYAQYGETHPKYNKPDKIMYGNKFYSIGKYKDEGAERYLCKGTKETPPTIIINTTAIDPTERYNEYWRVNIEGSRAIKKEKNQSYKELFKSTILSKYDCNDGTRETITLRMLVEDYAVFCMEHEIAPTPSTSGETMFMYLITKLNGTENTSQMWYEYYCRRLDYQN